jgi:hypothetical protein
MFMKEVHFHLFYPLHAGLLTAGATAGTTKLLKLYRAMG